MDRQSLPDLTAFVRVAELRSFRRAAVALGVSASALSHRIRHVETELGVRLLHRTTRSVAPTEAGERLLARLRPALDDIGTALREVGDFRERPAGRVRVNVARTAASLLFAPKLASFIAAYPEVRLEIVTDNGFTDIVAGGFDAGVRLAEALPADMIAVPLSGPQNLAVVGAPAYFETRPPPLTPTDLADHDCVRMRWPSGAIYAWEFARDGHELRMDVTGSLVLDDYALVLPAVIGGAGLAMVLRSFVADDLAAGRLVPVLEDWLAPFDGFHLYYPSRRQVSPALRAFIEHMRA
ncbi:LysR family transcriptional regulator [Phenylobacterium sp.]|uniref:LysR family transcriptional regulator n=1 Tax=Phenylobacterium sp. TaxID=1871053 RepID=UPI0035AE35D4